MNVVALRPAGQPNPTLGSLQLELEDARQDLREAEAELAREQAAVNAFRMHCRLKLDSWINILLALQAEKQSLLTQWQLAQNGEDKFWQDTEAALPEVEPLLLPTDTPNDKAAEKRLYRELARRFHPDMGRTAGEIAYRTEMMAAVNQAYGVGDVQALYDLAGELEPAEVAGLVGMETAEMRRLRQEILKVRGRERRAGRQLTSLRQENTARLWQKAKVLDEGGADWWEVVRREIERAIERLQGEVAELKERQPPMPAQLIVFSGLPGTGKSSLAEAIGRELGIPVFARDWLEVSLWRVGLNEETACADKLGLAGYELMTTLARRQLQMGQSAVLDSVAGVVSVRQAWREVAAEHGADWRVVECICSDEALHRARLETRRRAIPGWYEVTWEQVEGIRGRYSPWDEPRLVVDAAEPLAENLARLRTYLTAEPARRSIAGLSNNAG